MSDNRHMNRDPNELLRDSDCIHTGLAVADAVDRLAQELAAAVSIERPLALCVMTGGLYLADKLLPRLDFPLQLDYVHATRYRGGTEGGEVTWLAGPQADVRGRSVLLLDDILDEGHTLAAIRDRLLALGALRVRVAVLTEKVLGRPKPIAADFVGLTVPDRYVFGCGMDVEGWWRNLPEIRALK